MTNPPHADADFHRERLLALTGEHLCGTATAAELRELRTLLAHRPAARAEYVRLALVHAQLYSTRVALIPQVAPTGASRPAAGVLPRPRSASSLRRAAVGLAVASFAATVSGLIVATAPPRASSYDERQLPLATVATLRDGGVEGASPDGGGLQPPAAALTPTTLRPSRDTSLTSASGAAVDLPQAAVFGLFSAAAGAFYDGSVEARLVGPDASFAVTATNLRIVDKGTAFRVGRLDADHVVVTVLEGEVEVQSRVRLPVCHWTFDDLAVDMPVDHGAGGGAPAASRTASDIMSGLVGTLRGGARAGPGLVGRGAITVDNTTGAAVTIAGGTGDTVGSGLLAAADGISLEAVVASDWSGRFRDYDSIYRKEDGTCRVLLAFQNDGTLHAHFSEPAVAPGPCLSFGIHLAGLGYRELDMPLDGVAGRPALREIADGRPHHVVATFDSFTGLKAIFIDGRLRFSHRYPVGTMILSGGPAPAVIGNHRDGEPFTGTIDELAVYDFALTPEEIETHHARVRAGEHCRTNAATVPGAPRWQRVVRLGAGQTQAFNQHTGLPVAGE